MDNTCRYLSTMNNNDKKRVKNVRVVIRRVSFFMLVQTLQLINLQWALVESLSIQSRTSVSSPISSTRYTSIYRIDSKLLPKTTRKSKSILFQPLFSSFDDTIGPLSSTNATSQADSKSHSSNAENDTVADTESSDGGLFPSYKQLIVFTATTCLIWISEPLLSLVDTTIVGLTASAKSAIYQIAALGPATTLFDSLIYTTYFLAISTTNQLAPGLAAAASLSSALKNTEKKDEPKGEKANINKNNPWKELRQSTSHLLGLAIVFGSIVTAVTFAFGKSIIGQMVGGATNMGAADTNAIIPLANNYARIRATVAPFSIVGFVAQSFCLTTLDVATPAIAVAAASVVNILGDLALSPRYGIQGAALATALATVTSCCILLRKVKATTDGWKTKQHELENASYISEEATKATSVEKGSSQNNDSKTKIKREVDSKNHDIPFWSIPDKASLINLCKLAGPIFFVMIAKVACYNLMTIRATGLGILPLATHNIMMRVFFFFACFGDSLSQAAQSFYPQVDKKSRGKLIKRLFWIASFIGLSNSLFSRRILSRFGQFLTKESGILALMAKHSPWVGFAELLHPFIMLLEGTVLARRDMIFMVGSYTFTSLLHFAFVFSPVASTFTGLWRALGCFQLIRLSQFAIRVLQRSRGKSKREPDNSTPEIPVPPL